MVQVVHAASDAQVAMGAYIRQIAYRMEIWNAYYMILKKSVIVYVVRLFAREHRTVSTGPLARGKDNTIGGVLRKDGTHKPP